VAVPNVSKVHVAGEAADASHASFVAHFSLLDAPQSLSVVRSTLTPLPTGVELEVGVEVDEAADEAADEEAGEEVAAAVAATVVVHLPTPFGFLRKYPLSHDTQFSALSKIQEAPVAT
jgi:hypothetical protein